MGNIDKAAKAFFSLPEMFADMWNFYLFGGRDVVKADELEDYGAQGMHHKNKKGKESTSHSAMPDCTKVWRGRGLRLLIHEYQSYIDYRMVFRNMMTEAIGYNEQWEEKKKRHRQERDLAPGDEYLSGIKRNEKFMPIITLVINLSEKPWDGPRSLHETFEDPDDEVIKEMVTDYKLNIFDYHDHEEFGMFRTKLRQVFGVLKNMDDRERLCRLVNEDESYRDLGDEAADLIEALANITIPETEVEEGERNMCKAWKEQIDIGRNEGRIEGLIEGVFDLLSDMGEVADELKNRISAEKDTDVIRRWLRLAARSESIAAFESGM